MSRNNRQGPRRPATKLPHLQKKMQQQKVHVKNPRAKKK